MKEEKHLIKRAIILAAGIGKRMQPLTFETPKPLVKVNSVRMIDTVIDALHKNGIYEIYVVVGYLKDQFYEWARNDLSIKLIENPYYNTCNNISSLYVAREHLRDCIILDGDQIIYNPSILQPCFYLSGYNAVWCENYTNEWLMDVNEDGIVQKCSRTGGVRGWQLYSISRWTAEDGEQLKKDLESEFNNGNTQIYWDDVPMFCHFSNYKLGIYKMKKDDIIEVDNLDELIQIDKCYEKYYIGGKDNG